MLKKLKIGLFAAGLAVLFLILQYDFAENDSWESWNLPLSGKIIYLDPGHGGVDPGAGDDDPFEKEIALNVSLKLRDYLQQQGALVIMTRETDVDLADKGLKGYSKRKVQDLKRRLNLINESEADFFATIHLNAIPSSKWRGAQTFYSTNYKENKRAAKLIQDELRRNLENTDRDAKPANSIYLLKHTNKPGVLVEIGFLSNPGEAANLKQEAYQEKVAASIYEGMLRYFTDEQKFWEK
ncbi:N-acetylmuramoyl-L-alanine amidase CwlD [Bacillus sp. ISL-35]|uniref:N-acetylmuramoyl-L-alanine amidase CwlD n=1 Tax=Bacillus sp. ISL-35 TaxID=2819122 RepID=UPI001BEC41D6|nr:N-acetylmuramoyl-L-alanine amidase CwlD [Bacillus sp. ISL-35]MBT2681183.1 N-acetylmuramoyl-L-alanine amidase CwlD [Bacillus sp. ISL-35]MBT2706159.1 N-acetylmuramoyl-L-alanine amidase CwlD [Chryseobacterium sp. ISL-80]